jgi:hypothetical protein
MDELNVQSDNLSFSFVQENQTSDETSLEKSHPNTDPVTRGER